MSPFHFGPYRKAALAERVSVLHCTECDAFIRGKGVYTCGSPDCLKSWAELCRLDQVVRHKVVSKVESPDAALPVTLPTYVLLLTCGHEVTFKTMLPRYARQFRCDKCEAEQ